MSAGGMRSFSSSSTDELVGAHPKTTGPRRTSTWKVSARRAPAGATVHQLLLHEELAPCTPPLTQHCQHHFHTIPRAPTPGALLASPLPASPCPLRHASLDVRLPPRIRTSRLENASEDLPPPRTSSSRMVPNDVCRRPGRHDNILVRNITKKVTPPLGTHARAPHTLSAPPTGPSLRDSGPGDPLGGVRGDRRGLSPIAGHLCAKMN